MFEGALQNALDGVWANTIGRLAWLAWLLSYPADVWALVAVAFAAGMVTGQWGLKALVAAGALIVAVFTLGRRSITAPEPEHKPVPKSAPPDKSPARRKTLLGRFMGRG
jgi:hypothetical protein